LASLAAFGRLAAQDEETRVTAGGGYASARIFRGVERSGSAAQASLDLAGNGLRGGIWTSQPLRSGEPGETDLSAGYSWKIAGPVTLEATVTQYLFTRTAPGGTKQSTEAGFQATWADESGLTATLAGFHDFRLKADGAQAAVSYSLALKSLGAYLELSSFAGWVNGADLRPDSAGPATKDAYAYFGVEAQLPYRVGAHTTVTTGVHLTDTTGQSRSWSPVNAAGGARGWVSIAVNFDF
jgi:hypothetical protein